MGATKQLGRSFDFVVVGTQKSDVNIDALTAEQPWHAVRVEMDRALIPGFQVSPLQAVAGHPAVRQG